MYISTHFSVIICAFVTWCIPSFSYHWLLHFISERIMSSLLPNRNLLIGWWCQIFFTRILSWCGIKTSLTSIWYFFVFVRQAYMFYLALSDMNVKLSTWENQGTHHPVLSLILMSLLELLFKTSVIFSLFKGFQYSVTIYVQVYQND